jgi:hypothetical protein
MEDADRLRAVPKVEHEFLLAEYKALRDEILGSMERLIRIQLIGVTAIPLVVGAGERYNLTVVIAAGPLVTMIFVFILLYEQSGLMRAGRFIREVIEPNLTSTLELGWESWLEREEVNRMPERFFARASYIAFTVYYIGGIYFAHKAIAADYTLLAAFISDVTYVIIFLYGLWVLFANFAVSTDDLPPHRLIALKHSVQNLSKKFLVTLP